ncbi:HTH-type transcriptional regulator Ptr1 [Roseibium sp. TrichSKD4]|uniref:Lrp/AsnC family transcriptional regulator n=1 Tax=Roseibium sp. TrichSKD4 TaxID=744980 RepID=UPI0001E565D3|nr:Lrp/AsnC family transcriptional regulator [Roseibium sp. TrichSKD4]EFO33554.1 HTH-type transcriptional regulator Ptr1 [Roseibium sp. TrichSKD4]EFO34244.1 HTH-type transcriptional regulator Ptr1 [Roseibium sp. TrichSKD4]
MKIILDQLDRTLLQELSRNARLSWRELASLTDVSAPTVRDRIKRLEDTGVITGFGVELSPIELGYTLEAIVRFKPFPGKVYLLAEKIIMSDRIVQCDKVTGEDAFVARMLLKDISELDGLLEDFSTHASTQTAIVKSSPVRMRPPPLD